MRKIRNNSPGVFEQNREIARKLSGARSRESDSLRKRRARSFLRARVNAGRRAEEACLVLMPEWGGGKQGRWLHTLAMWNSQRNVKGIGVFLRDEKHKGSRLPLTIALWPGGTSALNRHLQWIDQMMRLDREVLVLDVSGIGALTPNAINAEETGAPYGTLYTLTHDLFCCGDSLCALNAYELSAAISMAMTEDPGTIGDVIEVYAQEEMTACALIAYFLDRRITQLDCGPEFSFDAWLQEKYYQVSGLMFRQLPGMLQYCDLPDLRRWGDCERGIGA